MRVCIQISTGKLLEMQSAATAGTLIANAIAAGFAEADLEERVVTEEEYQALLPQPSAADTIKEEMDSFELLHPVTERGMREGFLNTATALGLPVGVFMDTGTPLDELIQADQANQAAWDSLPYGVQLGIMVERQMIVYRQQYRDAGGQ